MARRLFQKTQILEKVVVVKKRKMNLCVFLEGVRLQLSSFHGGKHCFWNRAPFLRFTKTSFPAVSELCKKRGQARVFCECWPVVTLIRWNCVVAWLLYVVHVSGPRDKTRLSVMFRRWGFGKWLGHEAGDLVNGLVPVYKRPELPLSIMWEHRNTALCNQGQCSHPEPDHTGILILDFQPPEL